MGCASRVTPGRSHNESAVDSLPIENCPPGIQTMPFGAGVAGCSLRGTVGENAAAPTGGDAGCERHAVAPHTAPTHTHSSTRSGSFAVTAILYTARSAGASAGANEKRKTKNKELRRRTANREPPHSGPSFSVRPFFRCSVVSSLVVLVLRPLFFVLRSIAI